MDLPQRPPAPAPRVLQIQEQRNRIIGSVRSGKADIQDDGHGQLVIYTNLFKWMDGTVREEPDPSYKEEKSTEE